MKLPAVEPLLSSFVCTWKPERERETHTNTDTHILGRFAKEKGAKGQAAALKEKVKHYYNMTK